MNVASVTDCIQQAIDILTEMSTGDAHRVTATSTHFCTSSSAIWMDCWKNRGDILQSERRPRMRTSPSERGSGKDRLAFGRAATRLTTPWRSISRWRRPANCNEKKLVAHKTYKKEDAPMGGHDLVLQSSSLADPAASARETEPHLVPKLNMHEWHISLQVPIVQARSKSGIQDQNPR